MQVIQIVGFGLVAGFGLILLRQTKPEYALLASVAAGAMLLLYLLGPILGVIETLQELVSRARLDGLHLNAVLKIIGVAYLTEFAAQVLRDSGEGAVAAKVEAGGKILILGLAIPMVIAILDTLLNLLA